MPGFNLSTRIPACAVERIEPKADALRDYAIRLTGVDYKIGFWLSTPERFAEYTDAPLGAGAQLGMAGRALLATLESLKPRFHYSVVKGRLALTAGTTIMVTGRTRDQRHTTVATWDYGENPMVVLRRLGEARRLVEECPVELVVKLFEAIRLDDFCPPQALLSIVTHLDEPDMALGSAPGAAPIAIAVGRRKIHVVFDHRLYDPADESAFADAFSDNLAKELEPRAPVD